MIAVMEARSGQLSVTSSAVDLEPYPLDPDEPRRYFRASSICKSWCTIFAVCQVSAGEEALQFTFFRGERKRLEKFVR